MMDVSLAAVGDFLIGPSLLAENIPYTLHNISASHGKGEAGREVGNPVSRLSDGWVMHCTNTLELLMARHQPLDNIRRSSARHRRRRRGRDARNAFPLWWGSGKGNRPIQGRSFDGDHDSYPAV